MTLRIFACPECRCRKFVSLNALNVHLARSHTLPFRIILNQKGKAFKKLKKKQGSTIIVKHPNVRNRAYVQLGFLFKLLSSLFMSIMSVKGATSKASGVLKNEAIIAVLSASIVAPFVVPKIFYSLHGHRANSKRS